MELILKKDVQNLGFKDDVVTVKAGYGRNFLIPQGFAQLATPSAKKVLAENLKQKAHKEAKVVADAKSLAEALKALEIKYNGKFEAALIKKVARYQSIQLHYVANTFSGLNNRKNNQAEIERNIQYFLMTVLYDELTDDQKMEDQRVYEISYHPEQVSPRNFKERVLLAMHIGLIKQVSNCYKTLTLLVFSLEINMVSLTLSTKQPPKVIFENVFRIIRLISSLILFPLTG